MAEGARLESECTLKWVPGVRIPLSPQTGFKQIEFKNLNNIDLITIRLLHLTFLNNNLVLNH